MEILTQLIQGSYAYLLIVEILVITGLLLGLTWLIAQRTKLTAFDVAELTTGSIALPLGEMASPVAAAPPVSNAEREGLEKQIAEVKSEADRLKRIAEDNIALEDKVRFLESKLLEYEILQEEIGILSSLKVENAELKQKMIYLEQGNPIPKSAEPAPVEPEVELEIEPVPLAAAPEKREPELGAVQNSTDPTPGPTQLTQIEISIPISIPPTAPDPEPEETPVQTPGRNDVPLSVFTAPPALAVVPPETASTTTDELSSKNLESLLKQIDELTKV